MSAPTPASGPAVLRRLARISAPPWGRMAVATLLGVAAALATVGLLAGSGYVIDRAAFRPGLGAIAGLLAAVEVLAFIRGPLRYGERLVGHDAAFRALSGWRLWLYDRLEPLSPAGLAGWRSGDLLARATDDVDTLQDLYLRSLLPVAVTVGAAVTAVVLVALILPLAGLVLAVCLVVAALATPAVALAASPSRGRAAALRGQLSAEVVDLVQGAPELLAYGADAAAMARVEAADAELTRLSRRRALAAGATSAVVVVCAGAAVVGVLAAGVSAVHGHRMEAVMLAVLPLAALGAFEPVAALALAALRTGDVVAAGRRLLALGAVEVPVVDPVSPEPVPTGPLAVALSDAHLRYGPDLPWALHGLDLAVDPGGRTAVVGASGAGKSSVVNVLLRFWPLSAGGATLGGIDLERLGQSDVRRAVALVDQDAHLFPGSIRDNIVLSRPSATDDEVAEAVRLAQLDRWVTTLADGLSTPVGERGSQVSGGQRQRIALARALLTGAQVLVLDEPTAGLDGPTAASLLRDVLAASAGRTVLLVTHRQEDLAGFDRVVVMEHGRAVRTLPAPAGA